MNEVQELIFDEIVNEVNFLDARCREAFETIYAKLERFKEQDTIVAQSEPKALKEGKPEFTPKDKNGK